MLLMAPTLRSLTWLKVGSDKEVSLVLMALGPATWLKLVMIPVAGGVGCIYVFLSPSL